MATGSSAEVLQKYFPQYYQPVKEFPKVETGEVSKLLDEIIAKYRIGGEYGKGEEALLKRAKTKSTAETAQSLVSAGLAGTSVGAGAGQRWEEEIGMPGRLKLEDIRSERLTGALGAKAGFLGQAEQQNYERELAQRQLAMQQLRMQQGLSYQSRVDPSGSATRYPTGGGGSISGPGGVGGSMAGGAGGSFGGVSSQYPGMGGGAGGYAGTPESVQSPSGEVTPTGATGGYTYSWKTHLETGAPYIGTPPGR